MSYLGMIEPLNQRKKEMLLTWRWCLQEHHGDAPCSSENANANATVTVTMYVSEPTSYLFVCLILMGAKQHSDSSSTESIGIGCFANRNTSEMVVCLI